METIVAIWRYLSNLEWTEKVQTNCVFCDHDQLRLIYKVRRDTTTSSTYYVHVRKSTYHHVFFFGGLVGYNTC